MQEDRDKVDKDIWWKTKGGNSSVWLDNWTKLDPLFKMMDADFYYDKGINEINFSCKEGSGTKTESSIIFHRKLPLISETTLS